TEIHEKEMFFEAGRQACSRKIRNPRRASGDVGNRRNDICRLTWKRWIPQPFGIERPARIRVLHELEADTPATVAPFNHVNPARLIAAVGVIVARKEIPILIEHQVLRIPQAVSENFQLRTIRITPEHTTCIRIAGSASRGNLDVRTAIPDAEIQLTIRTKT